MLLNLNHHKQMSNFMLNSKLLLSILLVALSLAPENSYSQYMAIVVHAEVAAEKYIKDNDFLSAFNVMRDVIHEMEKIGDFASAKNGYAFLEERPLVANESLSEIKPEPIVKTICKYGYEKGFQILDDIQNSKFASAAEAPIKQERRMLVEIAKTKYQALTANDCQESNLVKLTEILSNALVKEKDRLSAVQQAEELANRTKLATKFLPNMSNDSFCVTYGEYLRGSTPNELNGVKNVAAMFKTELGRRNLNVNKDLVLNGEIQIGASECTVYSSWGQPNDINRTVGSWGVHKQFVYGRSSRSYIYIKNGRVSAFQD